MDGLSELKAPCPDHPALPGGDNGTESNQMMTSTAEAEDKDGSEGEKSPPRGRKGALEASFLSPRGFRENIQKERDS